MLTLNGRADSFGTCSGDAGIKRSSYALQLTFVPMATLPNRPFKSETRYTDFKAQTADLEKKSTTSK